MDKAKKKQFKKIITWVSLALVVAFLAAMPLIARQEAEADGPVASVLSGNVSRGSIASTIHGGGNIEAESVEDVILPTGVKIEGFLVKNGQFVKAGDPLAQVDKVSVMTAIMEVNETLEFIQDELEAARDEKIPANIKATGGGRVKKVFARPGEAVQDVMLRDGALAILSLDGLMAVKLEKTLALTTGETVTVTLAGGEEVSGRVESNLDGVVIITVEDEGYEAGQTVTVTDEGGRRLGQAQLYIHNAWKATAYSGTVESVSVKEEQTLNEGATILTLTDRDYEGELRRRANQHREYEALLQDLFRMYQTGYLYAPCDGEVEGVDNDSVHLLNATPEGWVLAPLNHTVQNEEKGWTVMLLSAKSAGCDLGCNLTWDQHFTENRDPSSCPAMCPHCKVNLNVSSVHDASCITFCTGEYNCDALTHEPTCGTYCTQASTIGKCALSSYTGAKHHPNCIHSCTYGNNSGTHCAGTLHHALGCIESCKEADGVTKQCDATGDHKLTCVKSCIEADSLNVCPADPNHSANCLERCSNNAGCSSSKHVFTCPHYNLIYTARVGLVVRVAEGVIEYTYESSQEVSAVKVGGSYTVAQVPNVKTMVNGPDFVESGGISCKAGDIILIVYGRDDSANLVMTQVVVHSQSGAGMAGGMMDGMTGNLSGLLKGYGGFSFSGIAGFGNGYMITEEDEGLFDLDGSTLLTVTAHDKANLVISIDEHDIAKLSTGMKATVKLAALKGEEFKAEITSIAVSGTNNGGSSKFAVTLTLPMSENMLSGMSASAVIELEDKQDILLIPAAALVQQGARTVVYTALDKHGDPSNPVEVKTGLSDGENVEILSGLKEGQTFYYSYYDTVELDNSAEASKYTFR